MPVSVDIPVYGEFESLSVLLPMLRATLPDINVLVVWDGPDDGTERLCRHCDVWVMRGPGQGLGAAIMNGIKVVPNDLVIVMDGDGQHPINAVQEIAYLLENGTPLVFGMRAIQTHPSFMRELVGLGMRTLAKPFTSIADPMTGLFGVDRRILKDKPIHTKSWKIGLEIAALCPDIPCEQVPFIFRSRIAGHSKANAQVAMRYFAQLISLLGRSPAAHQDFMQFLKFGIVGGSGIGVNLSIFAGLLQLNTQYNIAGTISFAIAVVWNYSLNRIFTFRGSGTSWTDGIWKYALTALLGLGVKQAVMTGLVELAHWPIIIGAIGGIGAGAIVNYITAKRFVFQKKVNSVLVSE